MATQQSDIQSTETKSERLSRLRLERKEIELRKISSMDQSENFGDITEKRDFIQYSSGFPLF